jgi:ribose 5-phosphate isomerase B
MTTTIFFGSDHGGYELKNKIINHVQKKYSELETEDLGCKDAKSCDYPTFGAAVATAVVEQKNSLGILICGSGVGISIAANRVKGARAVLANSVMIATLGRQHNGANILAMGARTPFIDEWEAIVDAFLTTDVDTSDRHERRRELLDN